MPSGIRLVESQSPRCLRPRKRVCRLLRVPAAAIFMKHLRSYNLCDIIILITSRHYYIRKYDVYAALHVKKDGEIRET